MSMLQIRENSIMPQHPVIFIGLPQCRAAVLSVAFLDRQTAKIDTLEARIETAKNTCKSTVPPSSQPP